MYRLNVVPVRAPELREHKEDIPSLIDHFLQEFARKRAEVPRRFSEEAMLALSNYDWPGNVRELENAVEYAYAIATGEELGLSDLPLDVVKSSPEECDVLTNSLERESTLAEAERNYILWMFERCGRHHIKTALKLGVDRRTLYRKLQQYGTQVLDH
jgi:DNA-binding NtrC family response regulator